MFMSPQTNTNITQYCLCWPEVVKLFSFLGEKCFPIFYIIFFQDENLKVPTVSCLNGFSVCSVIYSFNVNGAPPSPLLACVVQTLSSECRASTPIVPWTAVLLAYVVWRCEGPSGSRTWSAAATDAFFQRCSSLLNKCLYCNNASAETHLQN